MKDVHQEISSGLKDKSSGPTQNQEEASVQEQAGAFVLPDLPELTPMPNSDTDPDALFQSVEESNSAQSSTSTSGTFVNNTYDFNKSATSQGDKDSLFVRDNRPQATPLGSIPLQTPLRSVVMENAQSAPAAAQRSFKFRKIDEMRKKLQKRLAH